jgi:hypothetical protein
MNILGFISAILIIFSIIAGNMLKQHMDTSEISRSMKGYYLADNKSKNGYEDSLYDSQKGKKKASPSTSPINNSLTPPPQPADEEEAIEEKTEEEVEEDTSKDKEAKKIYACSCLNLYPLIVNDKAEEKQRYALLFSLIKILYQREIEDEKMVNRLIDGLITFGKKKNEDKKELCLPKVEFKDTELQSLWYKMLKGTKYYDFEKNIGFPSILEFVTLTPTENKSKICIPTSSLEMLLALYDKKIAYKIWEKRDDKKNKIIITRGELEKIVNDPSIPPTQKKDVSELIDISHRNHDHQAKIIIGQADKYQISIRRNHRLQ